MKRTAQGGFTLIESAIAAAVAGVAVVAFASAAAGFGRFAAHQAGPVHEAAAALAAQTLRVAQNAWKYGPPGQAPAGTFQTRLTVVRAGKVAQVPVTLTTSLGAPNATSADVTVTVSYSPDPDHPQDPGVVTLRGAAQVQAPLPASTVAPAPLVPQPVGAP